MKLLVTVGTTSFDLLIERMFQAMSCTRLLQHFDSIVFQVGSAKPSRGLIPAYAQKLDEDCANWPNTPKRVYWLHYTSELKILMRQADIVMCHCGAGTALEALQSESTVWAVSNPSLMNNHQCEIGEALSEAGRLYFIRGEDLSNVSTFIERINDALEFNPHLTNDHAKAAIARLQLARAWRQLLA